MLIQLSIRDEDSKCCRRFCSSQNVEKYARPAPSKMMICGTMFDDGQTGEMGGCLHGEFLRIPRWNDYQKRVYPEVRCVADVEEKRILAEKPVSCIPAPQLV